MLANRLGTSDDFTHISMSLTPNEQYGFSAQTYLTGAGATNSNRKLWLYNQTNGAATINLNYGTTYNSWQTLSTLYTPINASLTFRLYSVTDQNLYLDSLMLVQGGQIYGYGSSGLTGWVWNGAPNASTSFGPAVLL
jgi:hypothetical protein